MFEKNKEQKPKEVWHVIKKTSYTSFENYSLAKTAYSLNDAVSFKLSLENLRDNKSETYSIATDVDTAMDKVITLHNEKVANDNK